MIGNYEPRVAALRDLEATGEIRLLTPDIRLGLAELDQRLGHFEILEADLTLAPTALFSQRFL